jgi:hypothetical protein
MVWYALGFGLMILILQGLVPAVFHEIEATAIAFLRGAQVSAEAATQFAAAAGAIAH